MPRYVFKCETGHTFEVWTHKHSGGGDTYPCPHHPVTATRSWRSEGVTVGTHMDGTWRTEQKDYDVSDFLPMAKDFAGPDDPDGMKGLAEWRERHQPANKRARHPEIN